MLQLLNLVPKWLLAAVVAMLAATSCKLKWENGQLNLEVEKHATRIAELKAGISAANATAAEQATRFNEQARAAEQARSKREKALLADAAGANTELERLRGIVSAKAGMYGLRAAPGAIASGLDAPDPFAELLIQCSGRYAEVARAADEHANDAQTLMAAWPK